MIFDFILAQYFHFLLVLPR